MTAIAPEPTILSVGAIAAMPWPFHAAWFFGLAFVLAGVQWAGCAFKRALEEDPNRRRRAGLRELRRLLATARRRQSPPTPALLHAWMRASARAFDVDSAAPTAEQFTAALLASSEDAGLASEWQTLWLAAERSLFADNHALPGEWIENASRTAAMVSKPRRERWLPNRLAHWLPTATAVVFVIAGLPALSLAGTPAAQGQEAGSPPVTTDGSDTTPRSVALRALAADWKDWAAHFNLAIQLAQAGEQGQALAHASAAFVQQPNSDVVRDNLRQLLQQLDTVDPTLQRLLFGTGYQRMPTLASPAAWQRVALLASLVLAAGLGALVVAMYRPRHRRVLLGTGLGMALLGGAVLGMAVSGWAAYAELGRPGAAIVVRSVNLSPVPTDLVPAEETIPVQSGSAVVMTERSFLGWKQIASGRHRGWVRREALLPLYVPNGS